MDNNSEINTAVKYINSYPETGIKNIFLFHFGRSGSVLLQSLFDNHPQVIMIPVILPFHLICNEEDFNNRDLAYILKKIVQSISLSIKPEFSENLGENKNEKYIFPETELLNSSLEILGTINQINQKNIFLALNMAYAIIKKIDITKIKAIFTHLHYTQKLSIPFIIPEYQYEAVFNLKSDNEKCIEFLNKFDNYLIINTYRNELESFYSTLKLNQQKDGTFSLINHFFTLYYMIISLEDLNDIKNKFQNYIEINFLELHKNTEKTMKLLAKLSEIEFSEILFKSTIDSKQWWGNYPGKPQKGTKADIKETASENLDPNSINYCNYIFSKNSDKKNSSIAKQSYNKEFYSFIKYFIYSSSDFLISYEDSYIFELYPLLKNNLIESFNFEQNKLDNSVYYKSIKICLIRNINLNQDNYYSDSFLIYYLDNKLKNFDDKSINKLNKIADQIWLPDKELINKYIDYGIDPEIIRLIPAASCPKEINKNPYEKFTLLALANSTDDTKRLIMLFSEELKNENFHLRILVSEPNYKIINNYQGIEIIPLSKDLILNYLILGSFPDLFKEEFINAQAFISLYQAIP